MRKTSLFLLMTVSFLFVVSQAQAGQYLHRADLDQARLVAPVIQSLASMHSPMGKPDAEDWLYAHPERGQTFWQYVQEAQNLPTAQRNTIYVQPLGSFSQKQKRIVRLAAEFLCLYYNLRVRIQQTAPITVIPAGLRKVVKASGVPQLNVDYVLGGFLRKGFPRDAAARVAITTADLERPNGRNLTSVFGMAFLYHRTAVASIYRVGTPGETQSEFRQCLRRSLKLVSHETGHALSMRHCKRMHCNLNGQNSMLEMDRKPLWLCPDCVAKVCWASQADPVRRFERLRDFCARNGLTREEKFYRKSARRVMDLRIRQKYMAMRSSSFAGVFPGRHPRKVKPAERASLSQVVLRTK